MTTLLDRVIAFRRPIIIAVHTLLIAAGLVLAFALRFDVPLPPEESRRLVRTLPLLVLIRLLVFQRFGLHQGLWRYVDVHDLISLLKATALSTLMLVAAVLLTGDYGFPRTVYALDAVICVVLVGGSRLAVRVLRESRSRSGTVAGRPERALIVGAGAAGAALAREVRNSLSLNFDLVGFLDDDPAVQNNKIHGVPVLGRIDDLPRHSVTYDADLILVAIPSASPADRRRVTTLALQTGLPVKRVPTLTQIVEGKGLAQLEEVTPEDLLGRSPIEVDSEHLREALEGACVLVTGGAGSVGTHLAAQIVRHGPAKLLLLDRNESGLYLTTLGLRDAAPSVEVVPVVGDITNEAKVQEVFAEHRPDLVYHAAAYKHVPLMEAAPLEAIENNVVGTEIVAEAARRHDASRFVLVSTDKAVGPVSVMGMTKRIAEDLLRTYPRTPTRFMTVRFGNVLGSEGSVLPVFQKQIAAGRALTLTDPEAARFFMLLDEAAQLILQAGAAGEGGEIFILEMGEEVPIRELAESLIRLSGLRPGTDVGIETIGLREGERLHESLTDADDTVIAAGDERIYLAQRPEMDAAAFREDLQALKHLVLTRQPGPATEHLRAMSSRY